jgi:hypothetical protein
MSGSIAPCPHEFSRQAYGQLYIYSKCYEQKSVHNTKHCILTTFTMVYISLNSGKQEAVSKLRPQNVTSCGVFNTF